MVETIEQAKGIQDLFQEGLDLLKREDYRKYKILTADLFEWSAAIASHTGGNGNLGELVEAQIECIAKEMKKDPEYIVNCMFSNYLKGDSYAFASLFHR